MKISDLKLLLRVGREGRLQVSLRGKVKPGRISSPVVIDKLIRTQPFISAISKMSKIFELVSSAAAVRDSTNHRFIRLGSLDFAGRRYNFDLMRFPSFGKNLKGAYHDVLVRYKGRATLFNATVPIQQLPQPRRDCRGHRHRRRATSSRYHTKFFK